MSFRLFLYLFILLMFLCCLCHWRNGYCVIIIKIKNRIITIIIIIIIISFMQGIYICTYIPEINCVPREYSVAAIPLLLFVVLISLVSVLNLLYFYISTFRSVCAVPNMAVFCSSLTYYYYYYYHHHHHHHLLYAGYLYLYSSDKLCP